MPNLSDPITIREMEIKNRLTFPPMISTSSDANLMYILKKKIEDVAPKIQLIGDCKRSRDIAEAMNDAQPFARRLK